MDTENAPYFVSTAIPYVNARPHIGHAMELVLTDAVARSHRLWGEDVFFLTGTDENSLKNVQAAEREGVPVQALVDRHAAEFGALAGLLDVSNDGFVRTSVDPAHLEGVYRLWKACEANGDIYKSSYRGLYCVGCEQFYTADELVDGLCPEHLVPPEVVEEENYFFRLSHYTGTLVELIESDRLRILPLGRKNEVLGFLRGGLTDLSISRSRARARRLGHPGARRPGAGDLRLVRRPGQLHHRAGLRRRRAAVPALLGREPPPRACDRQGHRALPRRLLAGYPAVGRRATAHDAAGPRLPDGGGAEDQQVAG